MHLLHCRQNTGVGCHSLLQGIFPIQGSDLHLMHLLHCRQILYRGSLNFSLVIHYVKFTCSKIHLLAEQFSEFIQMYA